VGKLRRNHEDFVKITKGSEENFYNFHTIFTPLLDRVLIHLRLEKERTTKMKKVFLSLLVIILALGLLGAVGYAGYRFGFRQGMVAASVRSNNANGGTNGNGKVQPWGPGFGMMRRGMPMNNFGYQRGFDRDGFPMMGRGGFGFRMFPLMGLLMWLLVLGLIGAGIYWLIARSGWRLTRTAAVVAAPVPPAAVAEAPPSSSNEENRNIPPADS
jgi:hypothetical protein